MKNKRNTIYIFIFLAILTACGQNDIGDGDETKVTNKVSSFLQSVTIDKTNGNIATSVSLSRSSNNSASTELSNMNIKFGACKLKKGSVSAHPSVVLLDRNTSSRTVTFIGTLENASCELESYQVFGTVVLNQGKTQLFVTKSQVVELGLVKEGALIPVLNILDPQNKRLDLNVSESETSVKLKLTQGLVELGRKNIIITSSLDPTFDGQFFVNTVETDEYGNANFIYTAPQKLPEKEVFVEFCVEEDRANCDTLLINLSSGVIMSHDTNATDNDAIIFKSEDDSTDLSMGEKILYTVIFIDKQTKEPIEDQYINSITIESNQTDIISLLKEDNQDNELSKIVTRNKNNAHFYLKAGDAKSGTTDIKVKIEYKTPRGYLQVELGSYPISVLSGVPTNFEIVPAGVHYNAESKEFEQKFEVIATDNYSANVNTENKLAVSVMAGFAKDSEDKLMVYSKEKNDAGIHADISVDTDSRLDSVGIAPFKEFDNASSQGVNIDTDFAIIFGNVPLYSIEGKWNIDAITSESSLAISSAYKGNATANFSGTGFAIGHNYRQKQCSSTYMNYQVKLDGEYVLDEHGKTFITLKYAAEYMPGKQVALIIDVTGKDKNSGNALNGGDVSFITLQTANGLTDLETTIPAGTTVSIRHTAKIKMDNNETIALENVLFSCDNNGDNGIVDIKLVGQNNPTDCVTPYVEYEVTASDAEDGEFSLTNCRFNPEFKL